MKPYERPDDPRKRALIQTPGQAQPGQAPHVPGADFMERYLGRLDLTKLDSVIVHCATGLVEPWTGNATPPPYRSRTVGWSLYVRLYGDGPFQGSVVKPPLYRQLNFTWRSAKAGASYASVWPDDVLNSLSAIELARSQGNAAARFRAEYSKPNGDIIGAHHVTKNAEWFDVISHVKLANCGEAVVWLISIYAYPWLRKTRQVGVRMSEHEAAHFAAQRLSTFRREQSLLRHAEEDVASAERYREAGISMFPGGAKKSPYPGGGW